MARIDRARLKVDIHRKFSSLINFSKVSDTDYNSVLRILNSKDCTEEEIQDLYNKYDEYNMDNGVEGFINDSDRESVRRCIMISFPNYTAFCNKHSQFDNVYITNIIVGNLKMETPKYESLIELLKSKYDYDKFALQV